MERAGDRFERWEQQVVHTGYCCRPIRLRGKVEQMDRTIGEVRSVYSTEGEPDDVLLVACGSRHAARCRSCASWYRRDAFHLVAAGLRGGKGIPDSVESHPKVFAVHGSIVRGGASPAGEGVQDASLPAPGQGSGLSARGAGRVLGASRRG